MAQWIRCPEIMDSFCERPRDALVLLKLIGGSNPTRHGVRLGALICPDCQASSSGTHRSEYLYRALVSLDDIWRLWQRLALDVCGSLSRY